MKRWVVTLVLLLSLAAVLGGCGTKAQVSGTSAGSAGGHTITLGLSPWPGWYVWYLVQDKGFFQKEGVNVKLKWFPVYSDSLSALATGQIDANSQTLSDTLAPASKGIALKAVLVNDNSNGGDGIVATAGIHSIKDLKGKRVATELGTVDHMLLLTALKQNGMSERDIRFINMDVNDAGPAFLAGKLDAAVLWEPFLSQAVDQGKGNLLFSSKQTPGLIPDLLVFRQSITDDYPDEVKRIIRAWFDGLAYWKAHPDESMKIMAEKAGVSVDEYKKSVDSVKIFSPQDNLKAFSQADNYTSLIYTGNQTAQFLNGLKMIGALPNLSQVVDGSFVQAAAQAKP